MKTVAITGADRGVGFSGRRGGEKQRVVWKGKGMIKQEENHLTRDERRLGAIMGIAFGDAMGMPSECMPRAAIKKKMGEITGFLPSEAGDIARSLTAGEVTDDTENSLLVIELLAAHRGKVDQEEFVKQLAKWAESEKTASVIGPSTRRALQQLKAGVSIAEAGKDGTTNGAAMKIIPVGLVNAPVPLENLVEQVHLLCMPTHNTNLAVSAAAAVAAAVSGAVYEQASWNRIWELAIEAASMGEEKGYYVAGASVEMALRRARARIDEAMEAGAPEDTVLDIVFREIGTGLASSETAASAIALAYFSQGDPNRCGRLCANVGGDTDTIGAIACGLCGAYSGASGFRKEDIELLEKVNGLDFAALADSLNRCVAGL